jgi:Transcriptional Coactivator p15 (PC4)
MDPNQFPNTRQHLASKNTRRDYGQLYLVDGESRADNNDESCIVAVLPRPTPNEHIRLTLSDFRGITMASLRIWFQAQDGTWLPSKKGVTLKASTLIDVVAKLGHFLKNQ